MTQFEKVLSMLEQGEVEFVVVGGIAGIIHGAARATYDVDVVYDRSPGNIDRLVAALAPHKPYLRGAPPGLPFRFDAATVKAGLNFTLTTALGDLDLLGEAAGAGNYKELVSHSERQIVFGVPCLTANLDKLIAMKRAAGRPKDFEAIAELELIRDRGKNAG